MEGSTNNYSSDVNQLNALVEKNTGWLEFVETEVLDMYEVLKKNQYGQYLKDVLDGKYLDALN